MTIRTLGNGNGGPIACPTPPGEPPPGCRTVSRGSDSREAANGKPCIFCVVAFALIVHIHSRPGDQQKYHVRGVWPGSAPGPTRDSSHTARRPARRERTSVDTSLVALAPCPVAPSATPPLALGTATRARIHMWTHEVVDVPHSQRSPPLSQAGGRAAARLPSAAPLTRRTVLVLVSVYDHTTRHLRSVGRSRGLTPWPATHSPRIH